MVSVIVPVYNVKPYLRQCLDSIIAQNYRDLEVLVIDDGSTDGSGLICDEYAERDERIKVFHTDNYGLSAARNLGLDRMQGDYVAFLDSDDWLEENAFLTCLEIAKNSEADVVAYRFYQEYKYKKKVSCGANRVFFAEGEEILKAMVIDHRITEDVWNKFYKVELFENIRFPEGRIFEDKVITYKILQKAKRLSYTPSCLVHYRNRKNSLSNIHSMKSLIDYWVVYRERVETIGIISDEYYRVALTEAVSAISRMWRWYAANSSKEKDEAEKWLNEMQTFSQEHAAEIMGSPFYSKYIQITCLLSRSKSPLLFSILHTLCHLYRKSKQFEYYD